jgi:hypothetical protein
MYGLVTRLSTRPAQRWRWRRLAILIVVIALAVPIVQHTGSTAVAAGEDICPEPNDTFQAACYLAPDRFIDQGSYISSADDVDAYRFEVTDFGQTYYIDMFEEPVNYRLSVADWNGQILTSSTDRSLKVSIPMPGSYYLFVDSPDGQYSNSQSYKFMERSGQGQEGDPPAPKQLFTTNFLDDISQSATLEETDIARFAEENGGITIDMKAGGGPRALPSAGLWLGNEQGAAMGDDFTYTIDTRVTRPSDGHGFVIQLFFRWIDPDNYQYVVIDPQQGRACLLQMVAHRTLTLADWVSSDLINTSGEVNRFTVRAQGADVRLYANGGSLLRATDASPAGGRFHIALQASGTPPAVRFDNVLITTPGRAP